MRQSTVSLLISVISATATDIFGAAGATISINNSTPVTTTSFTACTSNQVGSVRRVIPVQAWSVTASANLVIDGATSGTFVMPAGARLEVLASSTTLFLLTIVSASGTWTPNQGSGLTVVGAFTSSGTFSISNGIKTVTGVINPATSVATTAAGIICTNLPFAVGASNQMGSCMNGSITDGIVITAAANATTLYATKVMAASSSISFTVTYK